MIKFAVCDDEKYYREYIREMILAYTRERQTECEVDLFTSGRELLDMNEGIRQYSAVFLDINMEELDGIKTAQRLRRLSRELLLIFVTAYIDHMLEGYKVEAVRYVLKQDTAIRENMAECMDAVFDKLGYMTKRLELPFKEGRKSLALEHLVYVESKLHKLEFHVTAEERTQLTLYSTLDKLEEMLPYRSFLRIHQSFLVNLKYVEEVTGYKVVLKDKTVLSIPKTRYRRVKEEWIAYQGEL